jgi:CHAT domain-containing protein
VRRGEIELAEIETDKALQRYPSEETEWHWRFTVLKAEITAREGRPYESLKLLEKEPPASLATSDPAVRRKFIQGVASAKVQQPIDATKFIAEAEALARTYHPDLLDHVALAKGAVDFLLGDTTGATKAYGEALQIARNQKDLFVEASALGGLGVIATKEERYDESVDLDQAAVQLAKSVGAQNSLAPVLGNMAWCYEKLGDFENARTFYGQAAEVSARSGLVGLQVYWLAGLSNVYYEQHDYGSAEAALTRGLGLARSQGNKRTLMEYLNALSEIALETGRIDVAEKYYQEISEIGHAGAGQSALDQSAVQESELIRGRIDESKRDYAKAEESFRRVIGNPKAGTSQHWEAEERLAKVYSEQGLSAKAEKEFRNSLERIETARSAVRAEDLRLSFLSTATSFHDDYIEFLISRHRPEDALQVAELSRARTLAEGLGTAPKTLSFPLRNFRPRQTARLSRAVLLFYWLGQKKSYLWVITPTKVSSLTLPGATQMDPLVRSYREVVLSGRDVLETRNADGARLYNILIEPAKKLIPPGSRVIVLPDESLYSLNFETLLVSEPKPHFWIEDVTVSTASSLTLLSVGVRASSGIANSLSARTHNLQQVPTAAVRGKTNQQDAGATKEDLLLIGNAVQASPEFPVLRQAETEMERIQHYFPVSRREVLAGPRATSAAFLASQPEKFAYIHFVTHGTASRAHPLDSAVVLSPEGDFYKLYARDIVKHPLSAYLVTVSACNGSGTRAYSGEGLVGLSWAFLRAGAHNVIAALWEVSDASTPQLMDQLYQELSRGQDPASALRMAKLSLLKSDSVFKKPFYWAPFQLYSGS